MVVGNDTVNGIGQKMSQMITCQGNDGRAIIYVDVSPHIERFTMKIYDSRLHVVENRMTLQEQLYF